MRADFSLDYDVVTVQRPHKLYLLARFAAGSAPGDSHRRPLNISLVIDRSGSMAGAKIDYTRQAAQFLIQHLGSRDTFSIVLYNDKVETLLAPEIVSNKDRIIQLIDNIQVRGTTNLSGGWLEGCRYVASQIAKDRLNRVILMTDGLANRGITDAPQLIKMAQQKHEEGVSTTTMGLGTEFNEDLLMAMANAGGGAYYFIESPEAAPTIFHEELTGLLSVVGQNLMISVSPTEHVSQIRQLNAYQTNQSGKSTEFMLGDIFGDEIKTLVLELHVPALKTIGECKIAKLRFEYDEITGSRSQHHISEMDVLVNIRQEDVDPALRDPEVTRSVLLLKAAQARQQAVKDADKGDYAHASQVLRAIADEISAANIENEHLQEERDALMAQAKQMERGAQSYDEYSRKTMVTQAFYTQTARHEETIMLRLREQQRQTMEQPVVAAEEKLPEKQPGIVPTHVTWNERTFELKGELIRIGRAQHNEIILNEKGISRFHCQIRREGDKLILEDLNSTNGTLVAGERITAPYVLSAGDVIYLCDEKLIFVKS